MSKTCSQVRYGPRKGYYNKQARGRSHYIGELLGYGHEVTLSNLRPQRTYYYRVGCKGTWSKEAKFKTAPPQGKNYPFSFVVLGDGRGKNIRKIDWGPVSIYYDDVLKYASRQRPLFLIHNGDLVALGRRESDWVSWLSISEPASRYIPHMPALGNHDIGPEIGDKALFNRIFALPLKNARLIRKRYDPDLNGVEDFYSFDVAGVHFVALSTETIDMKIQLRWLEQDLKAHKRAKWKILYFHRPIWSSGRHGSNEDNRPMAGELIPIIDRYEVDIVLAGHDHNYERFHPSQGGFGSPHIITPLGLKNGMPYGRAKGTLYIVSGNAGALTNPRIASTEEGSASVSSRYGFILFKVYKDRLKMIVRELKISLPYAKGEADLIRRPFEIITLLKPGKGSYRMKKKRVPSVLTSRRQPRSCEISDANYITFFEIMLFIFGLYLLIRKI
jgi:hypothetical protein